MAAGAQSVEVGGHRFVVGGRGGGDYPLAETIDKDFGAAGVGAAHKTDAYPGSVEGQADGVARGAGLHVAAPTVLG